MQLLVIPDDDSGKDAPILVVEDDPALRNIIRDLLTDEGYSVETAANGRQGLQRATARRPALVVLDMALPELNGLGVAAGLREQFAPPPPIVVITADGNAANKARQAGAFAFLAKPLELDELVDVVRDGLRSHST